MSQSPYQRGTFRQQHYIQSGSRRPGVSIPLSAGHVSTEEMWLRDTFFPCVSIPLSAGHVSTSPVCWNSFLKSKVSIPLSAGHVSTLKELAVTTLSCLSQSPYQRGTFRHKKPGGTNRSTRVSIPLSAGHVSTYDWQDRKYTQNITVSIPLSAGHVSTSTRLFDYLFKLRLNPLISGARFDRSSVKIS